MEITSRIYNDIYSVRIGSLVWATPAFGSLSKVDSRQMIDAGVGEDARGTPSQSHTSPSILVYEDNHATSANYPRKSGGEGQLFTRGYPGEQITRAF